jgi:serine/threonine-protein kinase
MALHGLARVSEELGDWNSCVYFLEKGLNLLNGAGLAPTADFRKTLHQAHVAFQDKALPRSLGPYRIRSRLGAGTFGEVYRAFDERPEASRRDVAVKVLRLEGVTDDSERRQRLARFRRECEVLCGLSHPNVVRVIEFSEEPVPYLVEEFLEGGDLAGLLGGGSLLPVGLAVEIMKGILHGLAAIHEKGVVHRDIKPGNVLLRGDKVPVLADFGLARTVDLTTLTLQSMVMGTLPYMAPEQLRGEQAGPRADIFAFGVVAFEALTGKLPRSGDSPQEVLRGVQRHPPADLLLLRPSVPMNLAACVRRCLEEDPERRYPTAAAVLADLNNVTDKEAH